MNWRIFGAVLVIGGIVVSIVTGWAEVDGESWAIGRGIARNTYGGHPPVLHEDQWKALLRWVIDPQKYYLFGILCIFSGIHILHAESRWRRAKERKE